MIIRFSLSLAANSASAYDEVKNSKCIILPSRRTLMDEKNISRPKIRFNKMLRYELIKKARHVKENQRYIKLSWSKI